jgi:hypothetical protein
MKHKATSSNGIGFFGLLTILFIGLKLTGYIDWSWVWVLAPIWIPLVITLVILLVVGVLYLVLQK